ncbi:MAG: UDP-N-acetylglucosamine--N-acetylmuramyl-(pentapeptide) pyrophosphoryl-undecaprenol N-acetylglucosamine transferase, partial [Janthinobacterium lividum]
AAAVAFPMTARFFRNASVTGVPVRQAIFEIGRKPLGELPQLLVTAGSQGAKIFNEIMPAIAGRLLEVVPGLRIMHQSGPRQYEETLAGYKAGGAEAHRWTVKPFLEDMPAQYAAADLVLARAGSTVAELAAAGRPSVLVPLPQAADDHQRKNAEVLAEAGAALMLLQADLTAETLLDELTSLLRNGSRLQEMGNHARSLAKPGAVEKIAKMIIGLAAGGSDPSDSAIHNRGHTNASSELR